MVAGFFTAFDPELKITVREGKVFDPLESRVQQVRALPEIDVWTETLEENAMVQYKDRQAMAVIKGVEDNFEQLTSIDSLLYGTGKFILNDSVVDYGFMGVELVSELGTGLQFVDPLRVYAPKRNVRVNIANPSAAFNQDYLFSPGAVFVVNQQKYDSRYILTSLGFARRLFNYDTEVSAIELKLKPGSNTDAVQKKWNASWAIASSCKTATSSKRMYSVSWRLRNSSPTCSLPLYLRLPASMLSVRCPC